MTKVRIFYRMDRKTESGRENAETCITLPMAHEDAVDLLEDGADSATYLVFVKGILENLAMLQDYEYEGFCSAELAEDDTLNTEEHKPRYRITWCDFAGNAHEHEYSTLADAVAEMYYLEDCPTQGPVKLEEISPDTTK